MTHPSNTKKPTCLFVTIIFQQAYCNTLWFWYCLEFAKIECVTRCHSEAISMLGLACWGLFQQLGLVIEGSCWITDGEANSWGCHAEQNCNSLANDYIGHLAKRRTSLGPWDCFERKCVIRTIFQIRKFAGTSHTVFDGANHGFPNFPTNPPRPEPLQRVHAFQAPQEFLTGEAQGEWFWYWLG